MRYNANETDFKTLSVSSPVFHEGELIPKKYTCDGDDINPPVEVDDIPEDSKSLALIVEDPDAPGGVFVHWLTWNVAPGHHILEGKVPGEQGRNDFARVSYGGPCPPSGSHRYFFKVYALDTLLNLAAGSTKHQLEMAMKGHILAFGEIMGIYQRSK